MSSYPVSNRELSWIEFNARVLSEALNHSTPLMERLNFLSIVSSNFDEFFMIRVASLKTAIRQKEHSFDATGIDPEILLSDISDRVRQIMDQQYRCFTAELLPALAKEGIEIVAPPKWNASEKHYLNGYFMDKVFPLITPLRIESDAFPSVGNLQIHCGFELETESGAKNWAVAQVPRSANRFVALPKPAAGQPSSQRYALLDDIIMSFAPSLFPGHKVLGSLAFKVIRDADSGVDEETPGDFLMAMEEVLAGRQNSTPICLLASGNEPSILHVLQKGLGLGDIDTYNLNGPINLGSFYEFIMNEEQLQKPALQKAHLVNKPWSPISLSEFNASSIWDEIDRGDKLIHVPYESFDQIRDFIDQAADDPSVLAIKMTLYRTSGDSPIVRALIRAARNRKQVAVIVELKARFDEERNIGWASTLEQAGAIVTYGVARLKVHAKAALVIRRTKNGSIRKYLHLSTGNYNEKTARLYSDLSILTANEDLCNEASLFFNMLTGYSTIQSFNLLAVAPFDLKKRLIMLIEREVQRSSSESPGLIMAKMNALADPGIIEALYNASRAGVRILLNVRGVCTLLPGVPGISETIEVRSVLGRYLEHSRMLYLRNGGMEEMYLSSADWLPRNLERRVELMFPVLDEKLLKICKNILQTYFNATEHAYRMCPDGKWEPVTPKPGEKPISAQEMLYKRVKRLKEAAEMPQEQLKVRRRFRTE
ncbi:MAG: polyphosphate kinase 1 [Spirochaetaceae bacterium]|nr:polyphosphate kinase 1 [Spirochaetaceae bacterium]